MNIGAWWGDVIAGWNAWIPTINWGSAADWVAGIGTVGALFLGLSILNGDRRRQKHELADAFSTWWEVVVEGTSDDNGITNTHELRVRAYNAGLMPVQGAAVSRSSNSGEDGIFHVFLKETGVDEIELIAPGERTDRVISFGKTPDVKDFYVTFTDGRGRTWFRELGSSKYVTRKKALGF